MMDGGSGMGITWIFGWLILAIIVGLAIRGICASRNRNGNVPADDEALDILRQRYLDILRQRYARGEITEEEFEHMKHELES
jgi:putative membrane protein